MRSLTGPVLDPCNHPLFVAHGTKSYPQWVHVLATEDIYKRDEISEADSIETRLADEIKRQTERQSAEINRQTESQSAEIELIKKQLEILTAHLNPKHR